MIKIYKYGEAPIGHLNLLPMIYARQDGKYLINEFRNIEGLEIIPHYLLEEPDEDGDGGVTGGVWVGCSGAE